MKNILLCAVLFASASFTQAGELSPYSSIKNPAPEVIGYIKLEDNGLITLTSEQGSCPNQRLFFFATNSGGKVAGGGCYAVLGEHIMATWADDGSMYQYSGDKVNFTQEWLDYKQ
jgi:hypothetical protein